MGQILKPVANIPLTCPSVPGKVTDIKGCKFTPAVFLNRGKMYFVVVTNKAKWFKWPEGIPQTQERVQSYERAGFLVLQRGFYDVPDKGYLTFITDFKPYAKSERSIAGSTCYIFEALEGNPPADWVPNVQGRYTAHQTAGIAL